MRDGGTGGRWSSPFVVRAFGLLVLLVVAAAGFVAAAVSSVGGAELPVEHWLEQPSAQDEVVAVRGLLSGLAGMGQGSS